MDIQEMKEIKVDINKNISDVIYYNSGTFTNKMTGKSSNCIDNVSRNKRFIIFRMECPADRKDKLKDPEGTYGYYDEEHDIFLVVSAVFKKEKDAFKWVEIERFAFEKNGKDINIIGNYKWEKWGYNARVDICGQTPVGWNYNRSVYDIGDILAAGFKEEAYKFFNGEAIIYYQTEELHYCDFRYLWHLEKILRNVHAGAKLTSGILIGRGEFMENDCLPPASDEAYRKMKKYQLGSALKTIEENKTLPSKFLWNMDTSCLQRVGNDIWQRVYHVDIILNNPIENSVMFAFEKKRCKLKRDNQSNDYENFTHHLLPVHMDGDFKGTEFEYVSGDIDVWLKQADDALKASDPISAFDALRDASNDFFDNYKYFPHEVIYVAQLEAGCPFIERLIKAYNPADENSNVSSIQNMIYLLASGDMTPRSFIESHLGGLETENGPLHVMVGVPNALLKYAIEQGCITTIAKIKNIFFTKEERDYLKRMNDKDCMLLYNFITGMRDRIHIFQKMITLKGYKSWKSYVKYLDILPEPYIRQYEEYLNILIKLGKDAKSADWNIPATQIHKQISILSSLYSTDDREIMDLMIKKRGCLFNRFCYENGGLIITYPKDCHDIIKEGMALHHCATKFVNAVAEGKTTLLFIRKIENPDKPFFTLEIKDGKIRQCHGFDNCCIDKVTGLEEFLKEFCKEKNLVFSTGEELLQAGN